MIPGLPSLGFSSSDNSQTSVDPLSGLLSGGFSFSPLHSFGGAGNSLSSTPTLSTSQTPTISRPNATAPAETVFGASLSGGAIGPALGVVVGVFLAVVVLKAIK